ncbi:MAG: hypothetical protein JWM91_2731 [Rhodospirillales bacterium]|nr:hypothetical protein [Rhodospirillales bacterium]
MAVASAKLSVWLLSNACLFLVMSGLGFAQTTVRTGPTPTVPGNVVLPGQDTPANEAGGQAGQGALISVLQTARPDYDANGVHLGTLIVNPNVDLTETFTSNVYATTFDTKSDFFTTATPTVGIRTDWDRNSLGALVSGEIVRYARYSTEDVSNLNAALNGRLDILQGVYANGNAGYQILHEPRGSPNAVNGKTPTEYHLATFSLGYVKENSIIGIKLDGTVDNYNYFDVETAGGVPILETNRNRTEYVVSGRVSYEIMRQYQAFLRASGNARDYDQKFDAGGLQRSSTGYQVDAGAALSIASKVDGEIYVGYLAQNFDDPRLSTASGLGFGANLLWNVDDLTSVKGSVSRSVEETIVTQASSFIQTAVSVGVEHELLRNVLLSANFNYANQAFQDFGRVDDLYGVALTGKYLLTRNLATTLNIGYTKKLSNAIGVFQLAEYDQAMVALRIRLQF